MDLMKRTYIALTALSLSACLQSGGGSSPAAVTVAPINREVPSTPTPTPTPAPTVFSFSDIDGKTMSLSGSSIAFAGNEITDTRCGGRYTVTQVSNHNGTVTIFTELVPASFVYPGNNDCFVQSTYSTRASSYVTPCNQIFTDAYVYARFITYTIVPHGGGVSVTRALRSTAYRVACNTSLTFEENSTMSDEVYQ